VQRRFTKRLRGLKQLQYGVRLTRLGLPNLELCRLHLDLGAYSTVIISFLDCYVLMLTNISLLHRYLQEGIHISYIKHSVKI